MTHFLFALAVLTTNKAFTQQKADTIKCYVQVMVPASGTLGIARNIEDNYAYLNGGLLIYTKAYAIIEDGKYRFLTPRKKEMKNIWKPADPQVMPFEW